MVLVQFETASPEIRLNVIKEMHVVLNKELEKRIAAYEAENINSDSGVAPPQVRQIFTEIVALIERLGFENGIHPQHALDIIHMYSGWMNDLLDHASRMQHQLEKVDTKVAN